MKYTTLLFFAFLFTACDPSSIQQVIKDNVITAGDTATALKQALDLGVDDAVNFLSAKDGYYKSAYKILLPAEARKITDKLKIIPGFSDVEDILLQKVNSAAEDAAKKAGPIFLNAIRTMSFSDATAILMGSQDAATVYLHDKTYSSLYNEFTPDITNSLDKYNAQEYWSSIVTKYNSLPLVEDVNPDLTDYVTTQALQGLFSLVEIKEEGIRSNISERNTDLMRRVFAMQDK